MTTTSPRIAYRGTLKRGVSPDTIEGEIRCTITGWQIKLTGRRIDGGYVLEGVLGETPEAFRVPGVDGEAPRK